MRSLAGGLLLALCLLPAPARAQDVSRLEPAIRALLRPAVRANLSLRRLADAPPQSAPPSGALAVEPDDAGVARLAVFVRLADPSGVGVLQAAGAEIGSLRGDIATARVPLDALEALSTAPSIAYIEAARVVHLAHDSSTRAIHVDEIRERIGDTWTGATGEGALVAIYDSGLDLLHDDFRDEAGNSRVLAAWNQTLAGAPPPGFGYGVHCDSVAIVQQVATPAAGVCDVRDFAAHGTHVTGTAAGDGSAGGTFTYAGVAPRAKILVVKGGASLFEESRIIDGLRWIRQEALRLGRPVVVNLSLGGQVGAHDGSRLYEQEIDNLSGPGFIVVISAGNQGVNRNSSPIVDRNLIHARGFADGMATDTFTMRLPVHNPGPVICDGNRTMISLWYDAADRLRIEVARPSGTSQIAEPGQNLSDEDPEGRIAIDNASGGASPANGDFEARIDIDGCGAGSGAPIAGVWEIRVTPTVAGSGLPYDAWIESSSHGIFRTGMDGLKGFDNRFVVASPGNATRAVTVGAFATRNCWPTQTEGEQCVASVASIGDLAHFSSAGPRRDGVIKPEITAPGIGVASSRSRNANVFTQRILPGGEHHVLEGTSMSAPHAVGTIALLYQVRPDLTPEEAKVVLMGSATRDPFTSRTYGFTGGSPADWWGAGKLNARDALFTLTGTGPAVLALSGETAAPAMATLGRRGNRLPLVRLVLTSRGVEAIDVTGVTVRVSGDDAGARLLVVRDTNGNAMADPDDVIVGSVPVILTGVPVTAQVPIAPATLRIPALGSRVAFVVIELSGLAPNGARFEATVLPEATLSVGVDSGEANALDILGVSFDSGPATTTVLQEDERVSVSENPVRGDFVIFNFVEPPTSAGVYTLAGRRVRDLRSGDALRFEWDLRNREGERVVPGVYLLLFVVQGQVHTFKLIVAPGLTP